MWVTNADRRTCRAFKFPLKGETDPTSPDTAPAVLGASPMATAQPAASVESPPHSAPIHGPVVPGGAAGPAAVIRAEPSDTLEEITPGTPTVTITPPEESTDVFANAVPIPSANGHSGSAPRASVGSPSDATEPARASTIDDAIANFHDAVGHGVAKTPEPVAAVAPTVASPTREIDEPTSLSNGKPKAETGAAGAVGESEDRGSSPSDDSVEPSTNGASDPPQSPIPFRRHSGLTNVKPAVPRKDEPIAGPEQEGEGVTMDEIDLNES